MYDTMQKEIFCHHTASVVYQTVSICVTWACSRKRLTRKQHLRLLPASGPLEYISMKILGLLPLTNNENLFIIVMTTDTRKRQEQSPDPTERRRQLRRCFSIIEILRTVYPIICWQTAVLNYSVICSQRFAGSPDWSIWQEPRNIPRRMGKSKNITGR